MKENIEFTEDYVWHVITLDIQEIPRFFEEFDDFYFPPDYVRKDRRDVYPLVIRANILFFVGGSFHVRSASRKEKRGGKLQKNNSKKIFMLY